VDGSDRLRVGIDVGGTFTRGVLLTPGNEVERAVRIPTTHRHEFGVAAGVLACLEELLDGVDPQNLLAINHSTTQATNALLEGDLSPVEVHLFHRRGERFALKRQFGFKHLELSAHSRVPLTVKLHEENGIPPAPSSDTLPRLIAETLVESEGETEVKVHAAWAGELAERSPEAVPLLLKATDISRLLGAKARVKTGVLNCAMLPTMLATLHHTRSALKQRGLTQPLMVLKSDGGVLPAEIVFERPLSCMLSGPAAGAAAALHFAGVTMGIFLEVGGTSTDISFIHDGRIRFRPAKVGGHRLQTETLDLRTIALGGGSLLGLAAGGGLVVGPRSAHVAGLGYLSFAPDDHLDSGRLEYYAEERSGVRYFMWDAGDARYGFTLTDLANAREMIPEGDPAYAPAAKLGAVFGEIERAHGMGVEKLHELVGQWVERLLSPVFAEYSRAYKVERSLIRLVGGGGGVHSALTFISDRLKLPGEVVEHYPYISAVGAALAASTVQVRLTSETGGAEDVRKARELAVVDLLRAGVEPANAHYEYSYDATAGILRLTATARRAFEERASELDEAALVQRAHELTGATSAREVFASAGFMAFEAEKPGRWRRSRKYIVVLDRRGKARLIRTDAGVEIVDETAALLPALTSLHRERREFRDAGEVPPQLVVVGATRIHDLSTLPDSDSFAEVLADELAYEEKRLIVVGSPAA